MGDDSRNDLASERFTERGQSKACRFRLFNGCPLINETDFESV